MGLVAATGVPFERGEPSAKENAPAAPSMNGTALTFEAVARDYLERFAPSHLKPSTRAGYAKVIEAHLIPALGDLRLEQIDAKVVRALDAKLTARHRRASTRRNVQAVLRSIVCRYAEEAELITVRPNLPRLPRVGATITSTLAPQEVRRLLEATNGEERLAFMLAAYAGLRAGEVRGLRWRDVNLSAGLLVVRRSICHGEASAPKSGHQRLVPLIEELKAALACGPKRDLDEPITRGPRKAWTDSSLSKSFARAAKRAGLAGWRLHDLRHFYVTSLFRARVPAPLVQRLAGHEHLSTTQRYAHLVELDHAGVTVDLERVVRGDGGETGSVGMVAT
jgi:integrase